MIFTKKNMFFILFIVVFVACCVFSNKVFADENDNVEISYTNLTINPNRNYFVSSDNQRSAYFEVEQGYIYHIVCTGGSGRALAVSQNLPEENETYQYLTLLVDGDTYDYVGDSVYLYFSFYPTSYISVTRQKISGYDNTIDSLTQAISLDNLWSQFGVGLISLVVLFALGFIVVKRVLYKDSNYKG